MHQGTTPTPPPAPISPQVPSDLGTIIRGTVNEALQSVSAELNGELARAVARKADLQAQLATATGSSQRARIQRQIAQSNEEISKLESTIGKLATKTTPSVGRPTLPPNFRMDDVVPTRMIISVVGIIFIGFPLAIAFARIMWRRASHAPSPTAPLSVDATRRFDHLEQSVDAIAIEVERISENQRYLTKLLSEPRQSVPVGAGESPKPH
jgi:hypothetical protein